MSAIDTRFGQLAARMERENVIRLLRDLIKIPSENPFEGQPRAGYREHELGEHYMAEMHALGLEVGSREVVTGRPNVWGRLKGQPKGKGKGDKSPVFMLAGHLDTVSTEGYDDPFNPRVDHGRVYGRGACDMKAALAAYLEVARVIVETGTELQGDLIIAGVPDEEWALIGSKDLGKEGPRADFGVIGEPTSLAICPAHKGEYALAIRTFGKAAHASTPELGKNAIEDMAQVMSALSGYNASLLEQEPHPMCGHGRFSMGVIRGGTMVATVPDACELHVDRRMLPGETGENVVKEYRARLDPVRDTRPDFSYELSDPLIDIPPLDIPLDHVGVQATIAAYEAVTGKTAEVKAFPGGTDAPNLGFPAIVFGPGSLAQAHTLDEYVDIDEMMTAAKVYLRLTLSLLM